MHTECSVDLDAETSMRLFRNALSSNRELLDTHPWLHRWLFADLQIARGERREMSFYEYEGVSHIPKFFSFLRGFNYPDYLAAEQIAPLAAISAARDLACAARIGVDIPEAWVRNVARYNAQDYLFQHLYPVPERQRVRVLLDFGAGHGRLANLAFGAPGTATQVYIAVDAIPATYLSQRAYFYGLGLRSADYVDLLDKSQSFAFNELIKNHDVIHIPTWRLDLIPDASVDMVCCVQVLKELPRRLVPYVVREFARILKPGAALYVRDHLQFHDPTHMPIDEILTTGGFSLEFRPQIRDREELHGLPRIWRRFDPSLYFRETD